MVSGRDAPVPGRPQQEFGTFLIRPGGVLQDLATPFWHWGQFYENVVHSVLDGGWVRDKSGTDGRAVNVKCDPDHAIALRERYAEVTPGWHMNKRHWNTVRIDGDLPEKLIRKWIVDSYRLVAGSLPKTVRGPLLEALDACAQKKEPEKPMNPNR